MAMVIDKHEHLLLQKAHEFIRSKNNPEPYGCKYDLKLGAWIRKDNGAILADTPDMQGLATKKSDIETGEDLKSE